MTKRSFSGNSARVVSGFSAAAIALGAFVFSPIQLSAQSRSLQIPDELCSFQPLTTDMIERVRGREDFPAILEYLSAECPEVALALAGPTASIPTPVAFGDNNGFNGPRGSSSAGTPPSVSSGGPTPPPAQTSGGPTPPPPPGGPDPEPPCTANCGPVEPPAAGPGNPGNAKPVGNSKFDDVTGNEPSKKKIVGGAGARTK